MIIKYIQNNDSKIKYRVKIYGLNEVNGKKKKIIGFLGNETKEYNINNEYKYIQIKLYSLAFANPLWFSLSLLFGLLMLLGNNFLEWNFDWLKSKIIEVKENDLIEIEGGLPFACSTVKINNVSQELIGKSKIWDYVFALITLLIIGVIVYFVLLIIKHNK